MRYLHADKAREAILAGEEFPEGLKVLRHLDLGRCTNLTALPKLLTVNGNTRLKDCANLAIMPEQLVTENLNMEGCRRVKALPSTLKCGYLALDGCVIHAKRIWIDATLPETVVECLPGRRLSEVFSHPLLDDRPLMNLIITSARIQGLSVLPALEIQTDCRLLDHVSLPIAVGEPA